jgi:hypothetical protein
MIRFHTFKCGYVDYGQPQKGNTMIQSDTNYNMLPYVKAAKPEPKNKLAILQREADRCGLLLPGPLNGSPPVDDAEEETVSKQGLQKSANQNLNLLLPPSITE